ncbi:MAG: SPFH/Band 7/PHB domain protein [Bacteroidaceae bacterium]|nr:SPFH/Band 7/PHB domain protein [Bacteroidaceae bacterium]
MPFVIILVVIVLGLIIANIRIVPQASEIVIERLGKFQTVWDAGLHVKMPFIDRMANRVLLKEQILDTPPQSVITSDNVTMQIDAVVYYKVSNSELYTYGTARPVDALANLTTTTLRNIIGDMSLDQTLTSRDAVNSKMAAILDKETDPWGIKVIRVELRNIIPPPDIREAMEKQMRAERERRETLLQAEGHKQAAVTRAEGDKQAMILKAEGERDARIARAEGEAKAKLLKQQAEAEALRLLKESAPDAATLELKRYDALVALANGRAAKLIVPTDVVDATKRNVVFSETTELGDFTKPSAEEPKATVPDDCCDHLYNDPQYQDLVGKRQ